MDRFIKIIFLFFFFALIFKNYFLKTKNNNKTENYQITKNQEEILNLYIEKYFKNENFEKNKNNKEGIDQKENNDELKKKIKKDYLAYCLAKDIKKKYYDDNNFENFLNSEFFFNKKVSNENLFENNNERITGEKIINDTYEYLEA